MTLEIVTLRVRGHNHTIVPVWVGQDPAPLQARLDPGAGHWTGYGDLADLKHVLAERYGPRKNWHVRAVFRVAGGRTFKSRTGRRWKIFPSRWTTI